MIIASNIIFSGAVKQKYHTTPVLAYKAAKKAYNRRQVRLLNRIYEDNHISGVYDGSYIQFVDSKLNSYTRSNKLLNDFLVFALFIF